MNEQEGLLLVPLKKVFLVAMPFPTIPLSNGGLSRLKIECDALSEKDWKGAAALVHELAAPFREVIGVPRGGLKLAAALQPFVTQDTNRILLVDDVLTTGAAMERYRKNNDDMWGVVLFARGPMPFWCQAVFELNKHLRDF